MDNLSVKGVTSCCQCNYFHTVKMRYQNEIEEIFKISEEFGSKMIKQIYCTPSYLWGGKLEKQ